MRKLAVCVAVALGAGVALGLGAFAGAASRDTTNAGACPKQVLPAEVVPMAKVQREAAALLPLALAQNYSPQEFRGFIVVAAVWLNPDRIPGANQLRAAAVSRCGHRTAGASWAVVVDLPRVHLPASRQVVFVVKTARGWRSYLPRR
jgi:hypothetical protein